jgi:hypothetical protein
MDITREIQQHILITLGLIIFGVIIGGGIGILIAWLLKKIYKAVPSVYLPSILFPWRSWIITIIIIYCTSIGYFIIRNAIPNDQLAILASALIIITIVALFSAEELLNLWIESGNKVRIMGVVRTISVASGGIYAIVSNNGASGVIRSAFNDLARTFKMDNIYLILGYLVLQAIIIDIIFGIIQMFIARGEKRQKISRNT